MRYWLYEKSKVSGPYDVEELRKMGFSRQAALFCGEQSRGENPGDWRKALEIEELRDLPPTPETAPGEEKDVKEKRILELEDDLLALKREIKLFQERDKVREHRQGQELNAAKEQLGQYAEAVQKLSSEIKSAEAKSAEQTRTVLQLRREKQEMESRLNAGTGITEAKLKLKEEELQNTRFKFQELEKKIPGDEGAAPRTDSAEAPEMAEAPSRPWGKVILVVAGISAIVLSGRWYWKKPSLSGSGAPAVSLSIPPAAETTAPAAPRVAPLELPSSLSSPRPSGASGSQGSVPGAAKGQAHPGPRPPAGGKGRLEPQSGVSSAAQGAASPPQSTRTPPAKFFPEGKRLLLPGLEKPVKVEVSTAAPAQEAEASPEDSDTPLIDGED